MALYNGESVKTINVVISGISGVLPKSSNIEEFKQNLFSANDMISEHNRWDSLSKENVRIGTIETLDRFDHSFFGVSRRQAEIMNISERILLEKVFEAILDAGYNPNQFKGTNTGVFLAICFNEKDDGALNEINEYTIMQVSRAVMANRISYFLDLHGPSSVIDSACSSSLYALDYAHKFIQNGECEAAIVCGINLCLNQYIHQATLKIGTLSAKGKIKAFDANADGYVRAEAIVATVLQKEKDARRVYANLIHSKTNCDGYTEEGLTFPSKSSQINLFQQFYSEISIDPKNISYIEAHGTGTKVGDKVEGSAISQFFCPKNRTIKLKIGSVKSNMGHSEACAGLCSLVKMIIAFETGFIPPNINFKTANPDIIGLHNGTMEVVTMPTQCEGEYFGLNSYGIGGSNAHILISPNKKSKLTSGLNKNLPNLITVSGRTEEGVDIMLQDIVKNREDVEYFGLWREIFSDDIIGYAYRGFVIINEENEPERNIKFFPEKRRPIWFIFAGMGSQWPTMGKSLLNIPIFAQSIQKSHKILETKGINLIKIITEDDPDMFKNIMNSFLGIAAIQIALVDTLKGVGIEPDGIIGHSIGELGCAYVDKCFTSEQTLLAAYYSGLVSMENEFIHGTMASIGESYDRIKDMMFPEIDIAAHNSSTNYTISGPTDIVRTFIKELQEKSIFVREINASNIPYHSRYIVTAGPKLISYLKELIPEPKLRSNKWISTSVPESEWNTHNAQYSSAEYLTNNLLNPVFFEQASRHIPNNAITIEIAPHGLLQAILRRSLPSTVDNIPLTRKGDKNGAGVTIFLRALGQIHLAGRTPKLNNLYPPVMFPVSKGTPMISPLIRWQHDDLWPLPQSAKKYTTSCERRVTIDLDDNENKYLRGHIIDGRNLFPATGYLCLIWETIALMKGKRYQDVSIVFENIRFEKATNIQDKQCFINFFISIQTGSGHFEISENNAVVASGLIRIPEDVTLERMDLKPFEDVPNSDILLLKTKDFYKALRLRGYHYRGLFKKIQCCNLKGTYAKVSWCDNFVSFVDNMLQMEILYNDIAALVIPTFINKIVIDVQKHQETLTSLEHENPEFTINYYPQINTLCSGGVQITGFKTTVIPRKEHADPVLETYQFLPYISNEKIDLNLAIKLCIHIALENVPQIKVKTVELLNEDYDNNRPLISILVADVLSNLPMIQGEIKVVKNSNPQEESISKNWPAIIISEDKLPSNNSCLLAVVTDTLHKSEVLHEVFCAIQYNGFIIAKESNSSNISFGKLGLNVCFSRMLDDNKRILLLRKTEQKKSNTFAIQIQNSSYSWIPKLQNTLDKLDTVNNEKLIIYAEKEPNSGILGFFNCIRKEQKGTNMRCFFIMDENAPLFSLQHEIYKTQFKKNLSHNVYKNGQWGSYRHLQLEQQQDIEVDHAFCTQLVKGNLSTFRWVQGSIDPYNYPSSEKHIVHVYYSGLNFKDVMISTGRISIVDTFNYNRFVEGELGFEYCGKDAIGQRYMGITMFKGFANLVETIPHLTWKVPDYMSLEDASTIPVAYATVIYAFFIKMNLKNGCSVLIHGGSGGIGQAAINICLHYRCEIFTTVGTPQKVEYIRKKFPQIPESHIGNSRDTSFFKMIMNETNGKGVDVVLNSLTEEKLRASIRCVAAGGNFMEIGRFDMLKNNLLELGPFINCINFHSIHLDCTDAMSSETKYNLKTKMQYMIDNGIVKPIDRTVFSMTQVEEAIRYMAAGKHLGKVVIKIRDEENNVNVKPLPMRIKAQGRFLCKESKSYLIIGGLGGFGLELADWLICRGARKIVLSSRTGLRNGYQSYKINNWKSYGVEVVISTEDITCETGASNLLQQANSVAPVTAIFNLAVILQDRPFNKQTKETFSISAGPKAMATIYLDKLSRHMCPQLKHFVVFSSVSCGRGNAEQTNYGMSNSIMERVCENRRCDGFPALAVQWGAIGEVGIVADFVEDNINIVIGGTLQQSLKSCLETLNTFMHQSNPVVSSMIVAETHHSGTNIIDVVANIIGIKNINAVSLNRKLPELGMDSIMATELQQVIESEIGISLNQQKMRKMTFAELCSLMNSGEKSQISG